MQNILTAMNRGLLILRRYSSDLRSAVEEAIHPVFTIHENEEEETQSGCEKVDER